MPLTVRTNGSGGSNIITSAWFNDIRDLLTGTMQDQEVSVKNNLVLSAIGAAPSVALTATVVAGAGLGIGLYHYAYTFVSPDGESAPSPTASATTTSGNQKVNLSAVAAGPTGTTARNIYRSLVGGTYGSYYKFLATINDNTTTTYVDTTPDGSLGANLPLLYQFGGPAYASSFGGSLVLKDNTGAVKTKLSNDGSAMFTGPLYVAQPTVDIAGTTAGVAHCYMDEQGSVKRVLIVLDGYRNTTATQQQFVLPIPFLKGGIIHTGNISTNVACWLGGSVVNINVVTAENTFTPNGNIGAFYFGEITGSFDRVLLPDLMGAAIGRAFVEIVGN